MFELILIVLMIAGVVKVASADNQSAILWGGVAFGIMVLCLFVPIPYGRVLLAGGLSLGAMFGYKLIANR